jgi:hypothetical protein
MVLPCLDPRLTTRLQSIHPVPLEENPALALTPAAVDRLLTEARVFRPRQLGPVLYNVGIKFECHANALHPELLGVALDSGGAVPYFGWSVVFGRWWLHSFFIDGDILIDSCEFTPDRLWWAMKYDRALFAELWAGDGDVPPVLRG